MKKGGRKEGRKENKEKDFQCSMGKQKPEIGWKNGLEREYSHLLGERNLRLKPFTQLENT